MKKTILWLAVLLMLCGAAMADTDVYHIPTAEQVQKDEAVQIAAEFIRQITGIELTGLYRVEEGMKVKGETEAYFGPGYQWYAETEEDCWVVSLRNETRISCPFVVVHGTTGEVVYWEYADSETGESYINMLPRQDQLSFEEAARLAEDRLLEIFPSFSRALIRRSGAFGLAANWDSASIQYNEIPVWHIQLQYGKLLSTHSLFCMIDAGSGEIYDETLIDNFND